MEKKCLNCKKSFYNRNPKSKFCSITCSNRYHLNNKSDFKKPKKYSSELAEFFGILLGDGSVTKYYARIYLNMKADSGYSDNISTLIKKIFPKTRISIKIRESRGTEEIQLSSKDLCDYITLIGFDPKVRKIPRWITNNKAFIFATIRGLFDTEGSIGIKKYKTKNEVHVYKQLTFTNKNINILNFVVKSLKDLGFSPTKNPNRNIYISNKKDIEKYFKIIGTKNPKLEKKFKIQ